ncbi:MAG: hypothetical protein HY617_01150 [Candidatus Sungbacteria bacterium]|nr:hypothetical protein [Candidatus Sungbacteria bacterium]
MFEKVKEISKLFVACGVVLYLFGFISLTSYFARFGIVSFDVVNSRFIIAGFFSFLAITLVLLIVWRLYKDVSLKKIYDVEGWSDRFQSYFTFWSLIWGASYALSLFFDLGKYISPAKEESLTFKPWFGNYDFIGYFIDGFNLKLGGGSNFIIKFAIYAFSYSLIAFLVLVLIFIIQDNVPRRKKEPLSADEVKKEEIQENPKAEKKLLTPLYLLRCSIETLILCVLASIAYYSYLKLKVSLFDFNSFNSHQTLTPNLVFAWFYVTILTTYFFLNFYLPKDGLSLDIFKSFGSVNSLNSLQLTFQHIFIPIIGALILFGQIIFPRIPFSIGGGEPREVEVKMKQELPLSKERHLFLIGESSQFVFVVGKDGDSSSAFQISKDEIVYIQTRKRKE